MQWYFWAPALVNNATLTSYLTCKGHLNFTAMPGNPAGTLLVWTGVWVTMP